MADQELSLDEVRRMAAEIGMTRLTDEHLQQLARATKAAQARRGTLAAANLTPADEPAHVFHCLLPRSAGEGMEGERAGGGEK